MFKLQLFLSTILVSLYLCGAYKILVVYPFPARSHNNLGNGVVRHLLAAGHEVTYVTAYPLNDNNPNLHQVDCSEVVKLFPEDSVNIRIHLNKEVVYDDDNLFDTIFGITKNVVTNENVTKFLRDPTQQFDVAIIEWIYLELQCGFAAAFNCPYIWTLPYEPYVNSLRLMDEAPSSAYVPHVDSSAVPPFTFIQRVQELYKQMKAIILKNYFHVPQETAIYEKVFGPVVAAKGRSLPSFDELRHNASMFMGNSHVAMGLAMRLPQSYKTISGYYIDDVVKPLPKDLQELMDNAKNGVIYFSLGTNLKSKDLPEVIINGLVEMFGQLKEQVIWKFEADLLNLPKNLHILKWAPQQSILAHPNCKLFITHGGLLSTTEAIHFGVPTIGIPVYIDQFNNVDRAVQKGATIRVDITYSLADDIKRAIHEMTSNPKYTERVRELSMVYHDRPVSAGAELVHWVEHVVRTRGAPHLRSPALDVPLYQKLYLDLLALLLAALLLVIIAIKRLLCIFCSSKKSVVKKKKN